MNGANTPLGLKSFPSDIGAPLNGSGGFGGLGDRVGARFEDTPEAVCWGGAGSCGFVGASGSTVGGDCEDLDLQGNHPIFPSIGEWWIPKR